MKHLRFMTKPLGKTARDTVFLPKFNVFWVYFRDKSFVYDIIYCLAFDMSRHYLEL